MAHQSVGNLSPGLSMGTETPAGCLAQVQEVWKPEE
jgi:hypothetical protein